MEKLYSNLVKKLEFREGPGGALPTKLFWLDKNNLEGIEINFGGGIHSAEGYWHTWAGAHTHIYDEVLFFLGLDTTNIANLGAKVAMEIGEEHEEHVISESAVVVVPRNLAHGPFTTVELNKPFLSCHILLGPQYQVDWRPRDSKPPKSKGEKYTHFFKTLRGKIISPREKGVGPGNADQLVWFLPDDLEGLDINFTWGVYTGCGTWHREGGKTLAHVHSYDELLVFIGLDPGKPEFLGAEIEIDMGPEHERHVFSQPTVVICPKGLIHTPITTRWVDQPFGAFVICLSPKYEAKWIE